MSKAAAHTEAVLLSIYFGVFTLMLGLGVLLYSFFPGPQHFVHGVYYLLRYFVTEDRSLPWVVRHLMLAF